MRLLHFGAFLFLSASPLYAQWRVARFDHITTAQGLCNDRVLALAQDRQGYMWLGTESGLSRFDGINMVPYYHDSTDPETLSSSNIETLYVDPEGTLWVGTKQGLNRYVPEYDRFERFRVGKTSFEFMHIKAVFKASNGDFWIGTYGEGLFLIQDNGKKVTNFTHDQDDPNSLASNGILNIHEDRQGNIWVGAYESLDLYSPDTGGFIHHTVENGLGGGPIMSICEDGLGNLWVASFYGIVYRPPNSMNFERLKLDREPISYAITTRSGNLLIGANQALINYDPVTRDLSVLQPSSSDNYSIKESGILSIYEDSGGVAWIGTQDAGVSKFDVRQMRFRNYQQGAAEGQSLSGSMVLSILERNDGTFLVGTVTGLDKIDRRAGTITPIPLMQGSKKHVKVFMLQETEKGDVWLGTLNGLGLLSGEDGSIHWYNNKDPNDPMHMEYPSVQALLYDTQRRLWVGTQDGLYVLKPDAEGFLRIDHDSDPKVALTHDEIYYMFESSDGLVWVGTGSGLNAIDLETMTNTHYVRDATRANSLSNNGITCVIESKNGNLWVGTTDGLNRLSTDRKSVEVIRAKNGLASNNISSILEDDLGHIWVATDKGISQLDAMGNPKRTLDVFDGLQSNTFSMGASYKSRSGELFFGGKKGMTSFFPKDIVIDNRKPDIEITSLHIFDKQIKPGNGDNDLINRVVGFTDEIVFNYKHRMIQFGFAVMHYANPSKNRYAFKLEGMDDNWVYRDGEKAFATFTNINPGTYTLRVKGAHHHDVWNDEGKSIRIRVKPAPWLSVWAYLVYSMLVALVLAAYVRAQNRKLQLQRTINEQQNKVNERLRQLDRFKDEILANTSHELRTPLNGIIGLADSLRDGSAGTLTEPARRDLATIVSCGKRLSSLINDILDYSRLKNSTLKLNRRAVDMHVVAEMVLKLSKPLVSHKDIKLIEAIPQDLPMIEGDENRLMQILHNLVGNAIKFTEKGYVKISARLHGEHVLVSVSDTGIGIPEDKLDQVFEAFEQGDSSAIRSFGGTGLGLAITKRLVAMHGGDIAIDSVLGAGTTFSFSLPVMGADANEVAEKMQFNERVFLGELEEDQAVEVEMTRERESDHPAVKGDQTGSILVVDDEPVNRKVLLNYLVPQGYRIIEASGGAEALQKVNEEENIDLILLDIMMPRMSGYEVCRRIREIYSVNELPVIFLSAKNQTADLLEGFVVGGNDYLAKPITKAELLARVNTHLELLDVNRNLEHKVAERTVELEMKNQKIMEQQEELIRKQRQLVIQEKMASLGTLTAGIAHEINNPVNFAHGSVQNLIADLDKFRNFFFDLAGPDADEDILDAFRERMDPLFNHGDTIMEGTKRIRDIVKELQTFSRMDEADIKKAELVAGIESTLSLVKANFADRVRFVTRYDDQLEIVCWPAEMNQVFMNLIVNGCQAICRKQDENGVQAGETLTITTYKEDGCAVIRFQDEGCGMPEDVRSRIFEPFYTTKPVGEGTGLGLSISYEIVTKHKGRIELTSTEGVGTTMTIFLPLDVKLTEE